ncbi:hypothetical protein [Dryocola sp. BD586]|uniref:hypothetical protein n=1 Tax=Dryocola sp. BD586 TaxID=3133271 RepID=UPI003F509D16
MIVTEAALLDSGFTPSDLQKIKNNIESYGGTLEEAINDLARRFSTLLWVSVVCIAILLLLVVFSSPVRALAWGLAIFVGIIIMSLAQPPILSYKSWRYRKISKD